MIYLDNSATTKPCPEAVEAMTKALTEAWGNPSALYGFGISSARLLRTARQQVAAASSQMVPEVSVKSRYARMGGMSQSSLSAAKADAGSSVSSITKASNAAKTRHFLIKNTPNRIIIE